MNPPVAYAWSGDLDIAYHDAGSPDDPPLLLIPGLGSQLIFFEEEFVEGLVDRAFRVIRIDNRDAGCSSAFPGGSADPVAVGAALAAGQSVNAPYAFTDMAGDAAAVLDALELDSAHVLGVSLGGMVAQVLAIEHGERVRSLTLMSTTTGEAHVGQPSPEALAALVAPGATLLDDIIRDDIAARRVWATEAYFDEEWARSYFEASFHRGRNPDGIARQLVALLCEPSRVDALATLSCATLVLHGTADCLIAPSGGERLAELIPDAEFVALDAMGHDLPPHYWAPVIEAITRLAIRS